MDNRVLIAFGMLIAFALSALFKGVLDSQSVKEIVQQFGAGILGYMAHKVVSSGQKSQKQVPPEDTSGKVRT